MEERAERWRREGREIEGSHLFQKNRPIVAAKWPACSPSPILPLCRFFLLCYLFMSPCNLIDFGIRFTNAFLKHQWQNLQNDRKAMAFSLRLFYILIQRAERQEREKYILFNGREDMTHLSLANPDSQRILTLNVAKGKYRRSEWIWNSSQSFLELAWTYTHKVRLISHQNENVTGDIWSVNLIDWGLKMESAVGGNSSPTNAVIGVIAELRSVAQHSRKLQ